MSIPYELYTESSTHTLIPTLWKAIHSTCWGGVRYGIAWQCEDTPECYWFLWHYAPDDQPYPLHQTALVVGEVLEY